MGAHDYLQLLAAASGVASMAFGIRQVFARRHLRCVDCRLSCPRTAQAVDCELVRDETADQYISVERCSRMGSGKPECEQSCVELLNLGIPLRADDPEGGGGRGATGG